MMQLFKMRLLPLVCFILASMVFTACEKDDDEGTTAVQLLSFGPTGAMHGDTLYFIGNNLNKVTSVELTGASVAQSAFIEQTSERISIIVPQQAEQGFVTLKTSEGDVVSKTQLNFEVAVSITAMPATAKPGETITITGEYLNWVTGVWFEKDVYLDSFVSKSVNQLTLQVPMAAQTGKLVFVTGGTEPMQVESDDSLELTLPTITSFSPNPAVREQSLIITGTDLDLVKGILFKGKTAADTVFISQSATQIELTIPKEANKGKISLVTYSGIIIEAAQSLLFVGDLPDLTPLNYAFYIDKLENGWQNWGWSSNATFNSTDNVRDGEASIKMDYSGQWGALKFANGSVSTANYNELAFSIYGTAGTDGKMINVTPSGGATYTITVQEGKWVEFKLTKAQIGNPATITDVTFQNQSWTGVVYIDHVGLR